MKDGTNKAFWQRVAKLYRPFMKKDARLYEEIADRIRPHLTADSQLLELATGPGILALLLADTGAAITATDYSEKMIAEASKAGHPRNVAFAVADATRLDYASDSFDAVLIANALHIMPQPESALAEIYGVLKPGGLLFAPTFVHGENVQFRLRARLMALVGFRTYHKWTAQQLADAVAAHGFVVGEGPILGGQTMPLCYLEAGKPSVEGPVPSTFSSKQR